jgi:hypothetical protein
MVTSSNFAIAFSNSAEVAIAEITIAVDAVSKVTNAIAAANQYNANRNHWTTLTSSVDISILPQS